MAKPFLPAVATSPADVPPPLGRKTDVTTDAGAGGRAQSQAGSFTSAVATFDRVISGGSSKPTWTPGEMWNDKVLMYQKMLNVELEKTGAQDVVLVEKILKVLVAEAYTIYPGFDGSKLDVSPETSAAAQRISETAKGLARKIADPACSQLLDSVARFWASYVRTVSKPQKPRAVSIWKTPSKRDMKTPVVSAPAEQRRTRATHVGAFTATAPTFFTNITNITRSTLNTPRNPTTTTTSSAAITTTTEVTSSASASTGSTRQPTAKAMRQLAAAALQNPDEVQRRAKQRDLLFAALATEGPQAIAQALEDLPEDTTLASYLPVPNPEKFRPEILRSAKQYTNTFSPDRSLVDYLDWYEVHHHLALFNDMSLEDNPGLKSAIQPKVIELCMALRALDETDDEATLKQTARAIQKMLSDKSITVLTLAQQPCASTRMMLQKCTLLQKYAGRDGKAFTRLRQTLEEAHQIRKTSHAGLQDALLQKPFNESNVVAMAASSYARAMTIPTAGYLRPGTPQVQLKAMDAVLERVIKNPTEPLNALHSAALVHVRESVVGQLQLLAKPTVRSTPR